MSRANFARAAFRAILAKDSRRQTLLQLPRFGGPGDDVSRPPHEADAWISTDDAWDYAQWVDIRVEKLDIVSDILYENLVGHPDQEAVAIAYAEVNGRWLPWLDDWRSYHADLRDSTWARVNSWDKIREWHRQLLEFREDWKAVADMIGLSMPKIASLPYELPDRVGDGFKKGLEDLGKGAKQTADVITVVAIAAAVLGGVYLVKTVK